MPAGQTIRDRMPPAPGSGRQAWWRLVPTTGAGWWSLGLAAAFGGFLGLFLALVVSGERGGEGFFSNPLLSAMILAAGTSAIAAGAAALFAVVRRHERSPAVFVVVLVGLLVLFFWIGEAASPH